MADVEIKPLDQCALPDDLSYPGFIQPSHFNKARVISGGSNNDLLQRDVTATTGASYTTTPRITAAVYPLTPVDPASKPNGSFWVEDDGSSVFLKVKRLDGSIASLEL